MNLELAKFKPFGWGLGVGAVLLLILMFSTGWVVTSSSAQQQAEEKAEKAVDKELAEICVNQFKQAGNTQKKLQKMAELYMPSEYHVFSLNWPSFFSSLEFRPQLSSGFSFC